MKKRTFIAISLPDFIIEEIERCQRGIPNAKWIKKENLHITLQFIGEISLEDLKNIRQILKMVNQEKFKIRIKNPKVFYKKFQKILWLSIEPEEPILILRNKILKELIKNQIDFKKENYTPHLTIARLDNPTQKILNDYLMTYENFSTEEFSIDSFTLFSSILSPSGAIYTEEEIYYLA